jgi:hypothetical protein
MLRLLFCVIFVLLTVSVNAQSSQSKSISYIETTSTWIRIYDESGKVYYTDSRSRFGEVVGYSSSFFIIHRGSFYVIYDANCRSLKTLSVSNIGEILSVAGKTFTARIGSFVCTYDMNGKKLHTRTVQ